MSFEKFATEDLRLALLQVLEQDVDYETNEHVLHKALSQVGHSVSVDTLHIQLAWCEEQQLIITRRVGDLIVAKLTARGEDVVLARARLPGVARPRPGGGA